MKLSVLDQKREPVFEEADFAEFSQFRERELLKLPEQTSRDGGTFGFCDPDTTHIITRFVDRLGVAELNHLPELRYVGVTYSGWTDLYFDKAELDRRQIQLARNQEYAPAAVAEAVLATLFYFARNFHELKDGGVQNSELTLGRELNGKTMGILGLGHIGKKVASLASGIGMSVISDSLQTHPAVTRVTRTRLLQESDVIGIFVPKSAGEMLKQADLELVKSEVMIINPSGYENISSEMIKAVLSRSLRARYAHLAEPNQDLYESLRQYPNAFLPPLFSCLTEESMQRKKELTIENLRGALLS